MSFLSFCFYAKIAKTVGTASCRFLKSVNLSRRKRTRWKFWRKVGAESVRKEPGVIAIYPMVQNRDSCQIRILEIYADQEAYKKHIASEHFQTYKQGTLHMVKSLDLVDMTPMNPDGMKEIFTKMK